MKDYEDRLSIPVNREKDLEFFTLTGMPVATNYERIVIGERGPYVEFTQEQVIFENLHIPENQSWRTLDKYADKIFYIEYRTNDEGFVKFYYQLKTVDYADYKLGMFYASPFALSLDGKTPLIKTKRPKKAKPKKII